MARAVNAICPSTIGLWRLPVYYPMIHPYGAVVQRISPVGLLNPTASSGWNATFHPKISARSGAARWHVVYPMRNAKHYVLPWVTVSKHRKLTIRNLEPVRNRSVWMVAIYLYWD